MREEYSLFWLVTAGLFRNVMKNTNAQIHIYTGDGKGKTTAALGLTLRAAGAGFRILFVQFLKKGEFSEHRALRLLGDSVEVLQFGSGRFVRGRPDESDCRRAEEGLATTAALLGTGRFDMVVLDEINVAVSMGMLGEKDVLEFLDKCPRGVEVVLTGRNASAGLVERADLVTECRMIKHYYQKGIKARTGIEK